MRLSGRVWKAGKHWLVEVTILDAMTQGRTRGEAVRMIADLFETMADKEGSSVKVRPGWDGVVAIETADVAMIVALMLRRQREKRGLSVSDVARLLGVLAAVAPGAVLDDNYTFPPLRPAGPWFRRHSATLEDGGVRATHGQVGKLMEEMVKHGKVGRAAMRVGEKSGLRDHPRCR